MLLYSENTGVCGGRGGGAGKQWGMLMKRCLHQPSEVSLNFSLLFFFRHFHGLKILPRVENFPPFRFGVLSPMLPPSPTIVLWCCSASSSKENRQFCVNSTVSVPSNVLIAWKYEEGTLFSSCLKRPVLIMAVIIFSC